MEYESVLPNYPLSQAYRITSILDKAAEMKVSAHADILDPRSLRSLHCVDTPEWRRHVDPFLRKHIDPLPKLSIALVDPTSGWSAPLGVFMLEPGLWLCWKLSNS